MRLYGRCLVALALLAGCAPAPAPAVVDAGVADAARDATRPDAARSPDVTPDMTRLVDAAIVSDAAADANRPVDARLDDATPPDAAPPDAALPDAALPDAAPERCGALDACAGLQPPIEEHRVAPIEACAFRLRRTGDPAAARALMAEVAAAARGPVAFTAVDLNRVAVDGITAGAADRLRNHPHEGFRWNAGDMDTADWYPQGITGISDARPSADPPARRLFVVSWYDHRDARPAKGARISLVDYSDPGAIGYRHLLLVVPARLDGQASFTAVNTPSGAPLHAGGIVWFGDLLYVADTTQGFRVFDLGAIVEVADFDRARIGVDGDRIDAHGYRYVVPQIARYQLTPDSCPLRFSFAGLDRSADPPRIVSGEYRSDDPGGRIARWPVGDDGWLHARDGVVTATEAFVGAQTRMQGGLTWEDAIYISSSSQAGRLGRLYRTRVGQAESSISAWVYGAEDLYFERHTDRVWTPAEHPGARDVVSIVRLPP